ncbi:MAG: hypothetical protein AMXMBFR82_46700 [Candidatus Hydrogenedentota bacterium]
MTDEYEPYHLRRRRERGDLPEVYVYNELPKELRVQIFLVIDSALGNYISGAMAFGPAVFGPSPLGASGVGGGSFGGGVYGGTHFGAKRNSPVPEVRLWWVELVQEIRRVLGRFNLCDPKSNGDSVNMREELRHFLLNESDIDILVWGIEAALRLIDGDLRRVEADGPKRADTAIRELNQCFRQRGVGYLFESGLVVRVDSQFAHNEIVRPAFMVLSDSKFGSANAHFLKAHRHYRNGEHGDSLVEARKCFESIMKAICRQRNWEFSEKRGTAKLLIDICLKNGLIPAGLQSQMTGLRTLLESGVPTLTNPHAHSQEAPGHPAPRHVAEYVLNMTASAVLFLSSSNEELECPVNDKSEE